MKQLLFIVLAIISANCAGGVMTELYPVQPVLGFMLGWLFNTASATCLYIAIKGIIEQQSNGQT